MLPQLHGTYIRKVLIGISQYILLADKCVWKMVVIIMSLSVEFYIYKEDNEYNTIDNSYIYIAIDI